MVTKILVASDIHDDIEALKKFVDFAQAEQADRVLLLGDLSLRPYTAAHLQELIKSQTPQGIPREAVQTFITAKNQHNAVTLNAMKEILERSGIPYDVIPGNYDSPLASVFGEKDLHLKTTRFGEAAVAGYGGADAFPEHIQLLVQLGEIIPFDHQELHTFLKREQPSIGLIHNPPHRLCDNMYDGNNVGTPATTQYIVEHNPKLILSGHIHEAGPNGNNPQGVRGIAGCELNGKKTLVVNPGNLGRFELVKMPTLETMMSFDHGTFSEVHIEADGAPTKVVHHSLQPEQQYRQRGLKDRHLGPVRKLAEYAP